ncbi:hypothetical protein [Polluticaenibacter yanchengensis]|uniref:Transcriptional regulator n=1 Tax=Polluticaenibacter yanchengensis TaxID=3014562 RepID=A0ABT4UIV8_9BACT|nr:hypothetical protein [Chitinophagaceae bacterium LY-5]
MTTTTIKRGKQLFYSYAITTFIKNNNFSATGIEGSLGLPKYSISKCLSTADMIGSKHIFKIVCHLANLGLEVDNCRLEFDGKNLIFKKIKSMVKTGENEFTIVESHFKAKDYEDLPYNPLN